MQALEPEAHDQILGLPPTTHVPLASCLLSPCLNVICEMGMILTGNSDLVPTTGHSCSKSCLHITEAGLLPQPTSQMRKAGLRQMPPGTVVRTSNVQHV